MLRDLLKAVSLVGGTLVIGVLVGCPSSQPVGPKVEATGGPAANKSKAVKPAAGKTANTSHAKGDNRYHPRPMLQGWKKPASTLVFSGMQHGYMEPCGCSLTQSGGLSRRADCLRQIESKGWPLASLDLGGLVRKDNLQNKLKFQVMFAALKQLGYRALALGTEELGFERIEPGFLLTQGGQPTSDPRAMAFINANIEFSLFKDPSVRPAAKTRVIDVGGRRIGVTAIFGKELKANLFGSTPDPQIDVRDPETVLPTAIEALKKDRAEVLILLAHASRDEAAQLAKRFPQFQLVITSGPEDGNDTPERIGKTMLIEVGQKGKHIAVVGYYPDDKARPFRFELVDLDMDRFHDTPAMLDRMREYQKLLESNYDAVLQDLYKAPHPSGDRFAGVQTCKDCHKKAYEVWKDSKHANAFETLITGREGTKNPIRRDHDPECLACHVTGWEPQQVFPYNSGFTSAQRTPHLKGQQCENCHGPATRHNELEMKWKKEPKSVSSTELEAARKKLRLTVAAAEKNLCIRCHDLENDPHFHFAEYWEQIKHPGKD